MLPFVQIATRRRYVAFHPCQAISLLLSWGGIPVIIFSPWPPLKPGHKAQLTCSDRCRKAASRAHLREAERRREEEARQQRQARWQVFQPTTRACLERVETLGGPALAEELAEVIQSERDRPIGKALA
jgi:hypothetical protein